LQSSDKMKISTKGQGIVMGAVGIAILLIIGLFVFGTVNSSLDRNNYTSAQNTTHDSLITNTNSGFSIGSILPLVVFAGAIMGSLAFAKFRG
jgi:hypothetical protein